MNRIAAIAIIPLFAGFLFAQTQTQTTTTTTKTTWNGTLVDAACQTTHHMEHHESSQQTNAGQTVTSKSETTRTETVDCPVTTTTTTFGLLTSDGRFIRFDEPSNTRVVEIVKSNQDWNKYLTDRRPLRVRVIGSGNGDVAVVESINPVTGQPASGESERVVNPGQPDAVFDVRYHDDKGKLVISADGVSFEDISNANHSRSWNYAQIKELKRDSGNEIKIQPYSGDKYELHAEGPFMSDTVYNMIADRIVAARRH